MTLSLVLTDDILLESTTVDLDNLLAIAKSFNLLHSLSSKKSVIIYTGGSVCFFCNPG